MDRKVHAKKFGWFAYYCWAVGLLTLGLNILG